MLAAAAAAVACSDAHASTHSQAHAATEGSTACTFLVYGHVLGVPHDVLARGDHGQRVFVLGHADLDISAFWTSFGSTNEGTIAQGLYFKLSSNLYRLTCDVALYVHMMHCNGSVDVVQFSRAGVTGWALSLRHSTTMHTPNTAMHHIGVIKLYRSS